uniref:Uncharacterized protein n=1 Tax=uncultured prokaryote TaxID=198431 RepID=A0A0H5PZR6_9ZZZZ|nr:unnamed protein product [uncultured bacterium]CRY95078.1 hypothetical protein [uncultured prokaryote]
MIQIHTVQTSETELLFVGWVRPIPSYKKLVHRPVRKIGARRLQAKACAGDKLVSE